MSSSGDSGVKTIAKHVDGVIDAVVEPKVLVHKRHNLLDFVIVAALVGSICTLMYRLSQLEMRVVDLEDQSRPLDTITPTFTSARASVPPSMHESSEPNYEATAQKHDEEDLDDIDAEVSELTEEDANPKLEENSAVVPPPPQATASGTVSNDVGEVSEDDEAPPPIPPPPGTAAIQSRRQNANVTTRSNAKS